MFRFLFFAYTHSTGKTAGQKVAGSKNQPRVVGWAACCATIGHRWGNYQAVIFPQSLSSQSEESEDTRDENPLSSNRIFIFSGILCLDLNPSGAQEEEEEDATGTLLSLAREAAPEEKVEKDKKMLQMCLLPKVKRISLAEASELEPNICLAGVGGALVATNEAMVETSLFDIK